MSLLKEKGSTVGVCGKAINAPGYKCTQIDSSTTLYSVNLLYNNLPCLWLVFDLFRRFDTICIITQEKRTTEMQLCLWVHRDICCDKKKNNKKNQLLATKVLIIARNGVSISQLKLLKYYNYTLVSDIY